MKAMTRSRKVGVTTRSLPDLKFEQLETWWLNLVQIELGFGVVSAIGGVWFKPYYEPLVSYGFLLWVAIFIGSLIIFLILRLTYYMGKFLNYREYYTHAFFSVGFGFVVSVALVTAGFLLP